ncbi:branched-chain amino acid ABC transporter permease [Bradyrhizobium sp. dw_78]|uniref:branched-chain amino acid ABC transporter permease n=1 Tax=Bradyrhizobium sp. dw_78 TaxID=2719793 RepID=UPI001BD3E2E2|nr:branched-chain amino acid ABC transporter permease [Bradyrhizobium sp. dw_78]
MYQTLISLLVLGLLWGGVFLLLAGGLNLIYGVMKVVNLAHGDFIVLAGLMAFSLYEIGFNPLVSLPIVALALFALGGFTQFGLLEHIKGSGPTAELRTLLATFGFSYVVSNISFLIWGSQFQSIPFLQGAVVIGGIALPEALLVCSFVAFALSAAVHLWLTRTKHGKSVRAVAQSSLGAETCGVDVRKVRFLAFSVGSAMAGAAGALLICLIPFQATSGGEMTVQAFTLIALGGLGSYVGAFLAAELLGIAEVMTQYFLGANGAAGIIYVVFVAVLIFRPSGLLGKAGRV